MPSGSLLYPPHHTLKGRYMDISQPEYQNRTSQRRNWQHRRQGGRKTPVTRLEVILNHLSKRVGPKNNLENLAFDISIPWNLEPPLSAAPPAKSKSETAEEHKLLLRNLRNTRDQLIIYTDGSRMENRHTGFGVCFSPPICSPISSPLGMETKGMMLNSLLQAQQ